MPAELGALGAQMLRLARAGVPRAERACVELVTPTESFAWLVEAARLFSADGFEATQATLRAVVGKRAAAAAPPLPATVPQFLPYVGESRPTHYEHYLPQADDEDFGAYVARVARLVGGREFGFQVPNLQVVDWEAFGRFTQVVTPLVVALGPRRARFNCFFGNYVRTPFGAHVDAHHLHSFQYVVEGRRRLRVWDTAELVRRFGETSMVELYRSAVSARRALPEAPAIAAGPGDVLYWPGMYTHCIESDGPALGISIVIESEARPMRDLAAYVRMEPMSARGPASRPRRVDVERYLARVAREAGRRSTVSAVLRDLVLDASGRVIAPAPARLPVARVAMTDVLESRLTEAFRIVHVVDGATLVIAVHGHGSAWTEARSIPDVVALLAFLERTREVRVRDVMERFVKPRRLERADVRTLLAFLVSAGAFRIRASDQAGTAATGATADR